MIEFQNVSFTYSDSQDEISIEDLNLTIPTGQVVVLCGESGCGKTTLTRLINGLIPHYYSGKLTGQIIIDGLNVSTQPLYETTPKVGSVFQNPRSQFFTVDTNSELAFACENMGLPQEDILHRIEKIVNEFHIQELMNRNIFALSGGEKQKIACASVSTLSPDVMVLDEPSSNLDIHSIRELADIIKQWKAEGKTVVVSEHRLYYLMPLADRILYIKNGKIYSDMTADKFLSLSDKQIEEMGLRSRKICQFFSVPELEAQTGTWELQNFIFSYRKKQVLNIPRLTIPKQAIVAIVGNNGAGKTTFSRCLCGLKRKSKGTCNQMGRKELLKNSYMVMQDVNHQLFTESVADEIMLSMKSKDENELEKAADVILCDLNLKEFKDRHPLSLSGGQKQRVAIGSAIAADKEIMVFDEPTSGLDFKHMLDVAENLKQLSNRGKTVFVVTHDPELISCCCNYFVFLENGIVKWQGRFTQVEKQLRDFFENS